MVFVSFSSRIRNWEMMFLAATRNITSKTTETAQYFFYHCLNEVGKLYILCLFSPKLHDKDLMSLAATENATWNTA